MEIPKNLKVGSRIYKVKYPHIFTEITSLSGQTCHQVNEIRITDKTNNAEDIAPENLRITWWHEILHCIDVVYNNGNLDEATIDRLGEGLTQVLVDNDLLK